MIEGKLSADREPRNVQVDLLETAAGIVIKLRDEGGVFLELKGRRQAVRARAREKARKAGAPAERPPGHVRSPSSDRRV